MNRAVAAAVGAPLGAAPFIGLAEPSIAAPGPLRLELPLLETCLTAS